MVLNVLIEIKTRIYATSAFKGLNYTKFGYQFLSALCVQNLAMRTDNSIILWLRTYWDQASNNSDLIE